MMSVAEELGLILKARGLTIGCAESCTGGLLSSTLTDVDGSSAYVIGSVVSYATAVKTGLLGVRADLVEEFGVVSEPVALEMALGVRRLLNVDIGLSTTGFAGPSGDDVGLVCIGLSTPALNVTERHRFAGDRLSIKSAAVSAALSLALRVLLQS